MLRITVLNQPEATRLKLEGKLAHEWVGEANKAWVAVSNMFGAKIIVDLRSVSFVDESGAQLLAKVRHAGAELVGSGPLISTLIEQIEDAEAARTEHD